jgi:hypothetical protein
MRLFDLPNTGLVVIAHTDDEPHARLLAEREECDYMLHPFCPLDKFYVINVDKLFQNFEDQPCPPSL